MIVFADVEQNLYQRQERKLVHNLDKLLDGRKQDISTMDDRFVSQVKRFQICGHIVSFLPEWNYLLQTKYVFTNTKSLAKEFSEILIFEYFGYLKFGFNVFFDADSESPRMT